LKGYVVIIYYRESLMKYKTSPLYTIRYSKTPYTVYFAHLIVIYPWIGIDRINI
jgi:hypothetical protein